MAAVKLDIHVHTAPGSRCSSMDTRSYLKALGELGLACACLTNHGDMKDFDSITRDAPRELTMIAGVEISAPRGDFLLFATDLEFLDGLAPAQELPSRNRRPQQTAVVWAHPFAGIPGGLEIDDAHVRDVAEAVDAIEIYNGNWPDAAASGRAMKIARHYGLAEVGGSDSHSADQLMRCWTEADQICGAEDLIEAILSGETRGAIPSLC